MTSKKKDLLIWLNGGCSDPDKREAEIEEMLVNAYVARIGNGLGRQKASDKVNLIFCRTPVYRLAKNGRLLSFQPHIDPAGRISWEQTRPTRQFFWQYDSLYGLDGKKVGKLVFSMEEGQWTFVDLTGNTKAFGKNVDKAKLEAIEALK